MTTQSVTTTIIRTLDQLLPGQTATIKQVGGRGIFRQRVAELGLVPTAQITMLQTAPLGDPIEYTINNLHLTLRRAEARVIVVEF
ncbi:ferrous iron transport protein A [Chloroflexota bacterium]